MPQDLPAPVHGLRLQVGQRHHRVDQAHRQRFLRVVALAQVPDLPRLLLADDACQVAGAEAAVEGADARAGLAEHGVVGGDRQVAHHVQDVAAADGEAGHHGDDRQRTAAHLPLELQHVEAVDALGVLVAGVAAHLLVAAGAERQVARAGQDDHADAAVVGRVAQRVHHFLHRQRREGVADVRAVDRDLGDAVGLVEQDLAIRTAGRPVDLTHVLRSSSSRKVEACVANSAGFSQSTAWPQSVRGRARIAPLRSSIRSPMLT